MPGMLLPAGVLAAVVLISADTPAGESVGAGFIVDPLGTVVTSLHIVEGATAIRVKLASGLGYDHVRVRAAEPRTDLVLLQLDGLGFPSLPLGDSGALRSGDQVVLVESAREGEGSVSVGKVRRMRTTQAGLRVIETDVRADRGSSGGPLLSADGRVVGVLSFRVRGARRPRFAIPIDYVRALIAASPAP